MNGIFERFLSFRRIPMRVVIITALMSYALQIGAIIQGQPLYIIVLFTLLPWIPIAFFEGLWKYEHYNWIAVFAVVTALQVGHIGEHATQVTQLGLLHGTAACPPPADNGANRQRAIAANLTTNANATGGLTETIVQPNKAGAPLVGSDGKAVQGPVACGVLGFLDFELIHLVWDTLVWLGALWLLSKFPRNVFLWIAMIAASAHEVEHLFIGWAYYVDNAPVFASQKQLWATYVESGAVKAVPAGKEPILAGFYDAGGRTGIMGQNGLVETLIGRQNGFLPRAYLHFGYNSLVVIPTVLGFLWQSRKVYDAYLSKALPSLSEEQLIRATPRLDRRKFAPGDIIVRQGDPADRFYIITRGQVDVVRQMPNGQEVLVSRLGEGQYFGEIGLMHGGKRVATVRAAENVEVMALDRDTFGGLMDESDVSRDEVDRIVRQRVTQLRGTQG